MIKYIASSALSIAVLFGCATHPNKARTPETIDRTMDAAVKHVESIFNIVESSYYKPVTRDSLLHACLDSLGYSEWDGLPIGHDVMVSVFESARSNYSYLKYGSVIETCINGTLGRLDGRSVLIGKEESKGILSGSSAEAEIGVKLAKRGNETLIISVEAQSPAMYANIQPGARITHVDGRDLTSIPLHESIKLLRGQLGSAVTLTTFETENGNPRDISMQRAIVGAESVRSHLVGRNIAFVRITFLSGNTISGIVNNLARIREEAGGNFRAVILDLRACKGGVLRTGSALVSAFTSPGVHFVTVKGRATDSSFNFLTSPDDYSEFQENGAHRRLINEFKTIPLVVLVSKETASGAEAVAASLQDHHRATIIGTNTMGIGWVETFSLLPDESLLQLTTGTMVRPNGDSIQGNGVSPDIIVSDPQPQKRSGFFEPSPDIGLEEAIKVVLRNENKNR